MYAQNQTRPALLTPISMRFELLIWLISIVICATVLGALSFEKFGGYIPCKLCLEQRMPYYMATPLCLLALLCCNVKSLAWASRGLLAVLGCLMLFGFTQALFHAGVEWHFWAGPADCGAMVSGSVETTADLMAALKTAKPPSCDSAPWHMFGLSFAGWNAVISALLAGVTFYVVFNRNSENAA